MKKLLLKLMKPVLTGHWILDVLTALPRILCGYALATSFGSDKFGMPWSPSDHNLDLFEVAYWFPQDVAEYGGLFAMFPIFFAWMGAFSEAIGGIFLALGLQSRVAAFLIACTMLVAIIFQKGDQGLWAVLPALGFLWMSMYTLTLGSGRLGLDYLITKHYFKSI
ncbi:MAG: putative oxidoreductase [Saprospiraceae bacterium]|jgi:putative oxidoreductase